MKIRELHLIYFRGTNENMNEMDIKFYEKFPPALKNALINKGLDFPDNLEKEYNDVIVYRGVRYNKNKREIVLADFESNIERKLKNPSVYADEDDIEYYGCSCYEKMESIKKFANYPRKNYAIAKGIVKKSFGPICRNKSTTHINLFLFKDIDPSEYFKVVEE